MSSRGRDTSTIEIMNKPSKCGHEFVYARALWGGRYNVTCEKCGEVYGSSDCADPNLLAGFNSNARILARRTIAGPRRRSR